MDRRDHHRKPCLLKVYLRVDRETWEGTILNYSEGGLFVASSRAVAVDDSVRLRFRRPTDASVIEVDGVVRRTVAEPGSLGGDTGYGIQLVEMLSVALSSKGASGVFARPRIRTSGSSISAGARKPAAKVASGETKDGRSDQPSRARDSRFVTYIKATYTPMTGRGAPLTGELVNVSRHGLFLSTHNPPSEDAVVSVRIDGWDVDGGSEPLELVAQVQWRKKTDDGGPRPPGAGLRIIGFGTPAAQKRYESLLRALLVVGNPIVGK